MGSLPKRVAPTHRECVRHFFWGLNLDLLEPEPRNILSESEADIIPGFGNGEPTHLASTHKPQLSRLALLARIVVNELNRILYP